jgi:tRNA threonylcarbamoyladenosine biosynthesis protein TsaE
MIYFSNSEKETFSLGVKLSEKVKPGDIFLIEGALGVGKSVLIRGFAKGLGVEESIPSPSFTLVNEYQGKYPIYHFDFYRINDPFELYELGFEDYIYSQGISFIEWPSKGEDLMPTEAIKVNIAITDDGKRQIEILWTR